MPELPELEVIAEKLTESPGGHLVRNVSIRDSTVIYGTTPDEFSAAVSGRVLTSVQADGKFLLLLFSEDRRIVVNLMLTGRFRLSPAKGFRIMFGLTFDNGMTLVYTDRKRMGRVYLVFGDQYAHVAGFDGRGPSALDPMLTLEAFSSRLRRFRGQIKNVLRNQRFVKGIGNAYADEIPLYAGILPFRRRSTLTESEIERLYAAMRGVLQRYREILRRRTLEELSTESRGFLMIHGKSGALCPLCGGRISEVRANRFKTNFCQRCQS
ncbi:MAG: Fpg/Nei family DNA glycosylase [Candidatus Thorarchaeota archaeon]